MASLATILPNRDSICMGSSFSKELQCNFANQAAILPASVIVILVSTGLALAQDGAKQDIKAAGTETKNAAQDTGHAVSTGTKKAYNKTASGTKTAADKTANGTETAYHKTENGTKTATDKTVNGTKTVGKDVGHGTKVAAKDTAHENRRRSATRSQANPIRNSDARGCLPVQGSGYRNRGLVMAGLRTALER